MADKVFPTDIPTKLNPVDADILLIADSEDNSEIKQITIGSITTDIADWIINDASASTTTTYSSDKINTLNGTQDSTISGNYTTLNNAKLNKAAQLRTGNGAWKTIYNDASGNETELTLGANGTVLQSNGAAAAPTWVAPSVDINGQTEATDWDMDNDLALIYEASAAANRKQKMNVYRASDAEAKAGTATNKFLTPAQNEMVWQYGVSTNLLNEWYTVQTPWATWTSTGFSPATFNAGGYWIFTAASDGKTSTLIPWSWSTAQYSPAQSKDIRIKIRCRFPNSAGFWLCISGWNVNTVDTDVTNWLVRFTKYGGNLFAHNSNGTTKTSTDVNSWITLTDWNTYEIVFNPWVDAKFYINGVLKATHTTNLPTTGTLNLSIHKGDAGTIETFPPIISFEL